MQFVGLIGDMGSGKTCFATSVLYRSHLMGRKVAANYALKFPFRLLSFKELATLPDDLFHYDIVSDELGIGADSYDFFDKQPKQIGKLITQLRKRHDRVYYTVQRFSMITKRLRIMTDGFILFEDVDRVLDHEEKGFVCGGLFRLRFYDNEFRLVKKPQIFDGKPYWNLYDTDEIVWD